MSPAPTFGAVGVFVGVGNILRRLYIFIFIEHAAPIEPAKT